MAHALAATQGEAFNPPTHVVFSRLINSQVGPSEWYLYLYLCGLSQAHARNPFRTSINQIRKGTVSKTGQTLAPIKMALNTVHVSLDQLARAGLIEVGRTPEGRVVHLDITIK